MKSGKLLIQKPVTLDFQLSPVDYLYINKFNTCSDDEKMEFIKNSGLEQIIKIANLNKKFLSVCYNPALNDFWKDIWCSYGAIISSLQQLEPILFFPFDKESHFELVLGIYYFHSSLLIRKSFEKEFSANELALLQKAIIYKSIHAIQSYNHYLYSLLEKETDILKKNNFYKQLIENNKLSLPENGSYGYLMLGEAYYRYSNWLFEQEKTNLAKKHCSSAILCIDLAQTYLDKSNYSIHNASLGQGLKLSNSLSLDEPLKIKQVLIEQLNSQNKNSLLGNANQPCTSQNGIHI